VQHRLPAVAAFPSEKSRDGHTAAETRTGQQLRISLEGHRGELALDLAFVSGFHLFGFVLDAEIQDRDAGRSVPQGVEFDDPAGQYRSVAGQFLQTPAGASAMGSTFASAFASGFSTDFDFSSFIIGEGVVTAPFICTTK
jgi:hypothetical protein